MELVNKEIEEILEYIIPNDKEIKIIINKINNNKELTFYENLLIDRIHLIYEIIKKRGE